MNIVGVIPARYGSTRFPGKPLARVAGKPLIQWVIEGASKSKKISDILVATDNSEIYEFVESIGSQAVMTASDLPTGSDRVWQSIKERDCDVVINIQGDEPLVDGEILDQLVEPFFKSDSIDMVTLGKPMNAEALMSIDTAKIVLNKNNEAMYFSRFPIPYSRNKDSLELSGCLKHIGVYAYRKDFLKIFCEQPPTEIELSESLEQLRALYLGAKIKVVSVEHDSWGVDRPEDIPRIEKLIEEKYGKKN